MVLRNNRRGVRTGNTLKASNSRYLRVYSRHAAFVRYSSNANDNENQKIRDVEFVVNGNTQVWNQVQNNVVYSLNKKGRWNLPNQLQEFICDSDHTDDSCRLTLLKSCKLWRQANSFGYWSTSGDTKKVKPKKFFHRNTVLDPSTKRSVDIDSEGEEKHYDEAEPKSNKNCPYAGKEKGEVIYEVYYPVPIKCSIAHNPKYIQDAWAPNDVKKGKKHPSLNHTKNYGRIWEEESGKDENGYCNSDLDDIVDESETEEYRNFAAPEKEMVVNLEDLLKVVQKAKHLSEISYQKKELQTSTPTPKKYGKGESILIPKYQPTTFTHKSSLEMVGTEIVLKSADVTLQVLKEKYGSEFHQINCFPRKFLINITEEVERFSFSNQTRTQCLGMDLSSYLIFTHQAVNDEESDIYRVCLNMNFPKEVCLRIETLFSMSECKVHDVVKAAVCFVGTLPQEYFQEKVKYPQKNSLLDLTNLQTQNEWNIKIQVSNIAYSTFFMDQMAVNEPISDFEIISSEPDFCDLCFEEIDPSKLNSKTSTALLQCSHWFCDDCWTQYLITEMKKKDNPSICCPEDNCTSMVDLGVCLSLVGIHDVLQYIRQQDKMPMKEKEIKWCPVPNCNQLLCVSSDKIDSCQMLSVVCQCGNEACFICLQPSHWPASCQQNQLYLSKLKSDRKDATLKKTETSPKQKKSENYLSSKDIKLPGSSRHVGRKRKNRGLYTFTVRHHKLRQRDHIIFLKMNGNKFTNRILNLVKSQGVSVVSDISPITDISLGSDSMKIIQTQVTELVNAIVNLIPKIHQVIEFTAVYLDGPSQKELSPEQIKHIIWKLEFITLQMTEILIKEKKSDLENAIRTLIQLQNSSQRTIKALLKFL